MRIKSSGRIQFSMDSRWMEGSVIAMGIGVFIRAVYYLGLINFSNIPFPDLIFDMVLPVASSAAYLLFIRGLNLNAPVLIGSLFALISIDYFLAMDPQESVSVVITGCYAALFLAGALGFIKDIWILWIASAVCIVYRLIWVDIFGYVLPITEFHPVEYLPRLSNLFMILAMGLVSPALHLITRRDS